MSDMQTTPEVKAILVSDIHLQSKPPIARANESDWFGAMNKPLNELWALQKRCNLVPVVYAGDIFDKWNTGPETINFAIKHLPPGYAIPGQHDLPNHNYGEIKRSAYWTLVSSGILENLEPEKETVITKDILIYSFPWGFKPKPIKPKEGIIQLAIIHAFVWTKDTGYRGASVTHRIGTYRKALSGYDAVAFGDNHKGFIKKIPDGAWVCNCGGFMRRRVDEIDYKPGCGLLHADGSISRYYFTTAGEAFNETSKGEEDLSDKFNMEAFAESLNELGKDGSFDFIAALNRFISDNNVSEETKKIILNACDEGATK